MTWNEQIRGLRRSLRGKAKTPGALGRQRAQQRARKEPKPESIVVTGKVKQEFLDRMRAIGVRVELRS